MHKTNQDSKNNAKSNIKLDSKENTESNITIESKKLDSNGDEIVFEVKHDVFIFDTIYQYFLFLTGMFFSIIALINPSDDIVVNIFIFVPSFFVTLDCSIILFYRRKNRIYVTNYGIGFERRHWFKMQKGFFRFGETGVAIATFGATNQNAEIFIFFPFNSKQPKRVGFLPKCYQKVTIQGIEEYTFTREILTFIRQKTKEALESQGKSISDEELKEKFKHFSHKDI